MGDYQLGIAGLGVMGKNLALNFASKGFKTAVFNRTENITEEFISKHKDSNIKGAFSLKDFISLLGRPRVIVLMVTAGQAVDSMIDNMLPLLEEGDIIVDAGNSYFKDTMRRSESLSKKGILFAGIGISGGEEGALKGPSIMAGCSQEAWQVIAPMFSSISAKAYDGSPTCDRMGPDGSGHYVKMVHNAIEYIDMQLISEVFHIMQRAGYTYSEMADLFENWNKGDLESYLIQITSKILRKKDSETGSSILDVIMDTAEQKGTGLWAAESSMELGVPVYSIAASVYSRFMSSRKEERVEASKHRPKSVKIEVDEDQLHDALYASKICAYSQGFYLLSEASRFYKWGIDNAAVAHIWQGGCIIRARLLQNVEDAFRDKHLKNLLLDPFLLRSVVEKEKAWRNLVSAAIDAGIPVPGMSSALSYYDGYFTSRLPANLIQAQRDYFGAHTYTRVDRQGSFHTEWERD
ncbi:MAG: NADP-dependent phosphogluconate dehydrogenase [Conexivisphaerales archaeon]